MLLNARTPTLDDFDAFFENCFFADRDNAGLRAAVEHEWRVFLPHPSRSLVVEDLERDPGRRIVGCAQVVFVTEEFVQWARSAVAPWINRAAAQRLPDGSCPLMSVAGVRAANTQGEGVNVLLTRWGRANALVNAEEGRRIHTFLHRSFPALTRGYRIKEMLWEAIGDDARRQALAAGGRLRTDYAAYYGGNPPQPQPYLMGLTREEAMESEGCLMSHVFIYTPPRLGFKDEDAQKLCRALQGSTDEMLAEEFHLTPSGIKSWWKRLYERVENIVPEALPARECAGTENARGTERRRLLLNYLREHPEEVYFP